MLSEGQSDYEEMMRMSLMIGVEKDSKRWTDGNTMLATVHKNVSTTKNMQKMRKDIPYTTPHFSITKMEGVLITARKTIDIKRRGRFIIVFHVPKVDRMLQST